MISVSRYVVSHRSPPSNLRCTRIVLAFQVMEDDTLARLISMPNTIVTSHQAFLTEEALKNIAESTVQSLIDFFDGKPLSEDNTVRAPPKAEKST